ncbi:unnamed protein product [Blepharisma stoltei]|uniref:Palmitoyltransferase n=1 Tax=Blepharisma stoltei TaxID=1481888 RepID=A0AAU9IPT8_9CILI|nr:unnamed protein product [Blepharisma stoltei]
MRKNGFRRPINPYQVSSWVFTFLFTAIFYILMLPAFQVDQAVLIGAAFSMFLTLFLMLGFLCTYSDPTDPAVIQGLQARIKSISVDAKKYPKICKLCRTHVSAGSKHCRFCNRCVNGFDHHCKWLNNCIGKKNYSTFAKLISVLEIILIMIVGTGSGILAGVLEDKDIKQNLIQNFNFSELLIKIYIAIICITVIICGIITIANAQLILLHIWLNYKGMSTYEYILKKRKAKASVSSENAVKGYSLNEMYEPYEENPEYSKDQTMVENSQAHHKQNLSFDSQSEANFEESMKFEKKCLTEAKNSLEHHSANRLASA